MNFLRKNLLQFVVGGLFIWYIATEPPSYWMLFNAFALGAIFMTVYMSAVEWWIRRKHE